MLQELRRIVWNGRPGELRDLAFGSALVHLDGDPPTETVWVSAGELELVDQVEE